MIKFRCIEEINTQIIPNGYRKVIKYTLKNGKRGTEVFTQISDNTKSRTVEIGLDDLPERVYEYTGTERFTYLPAYPIRPNGVFRYNEQFMRTYFPQISFKKLCEEILTEANGIKEHII